MADLLYPTSTELRVVEQDLLPRLQQDRLIFQYMPIVNSDTYRLEWEQLDNFIGLQHVRGLEGAFPRVKKTGAKRYSMTPGVYGEHSPINEHDLTMRRQFGSYTEPINITDLVGIEQIKLLQRRLDRIEYIGWQLLQNGVFAVSDEDGQILHTDTFPITTFTAGTSWVNLSSSTPLANLRQLALLHRGKSVSFGKGAFLVVNQTTANALMANTNTADIYGRRLGFPPLNNIDDFNRLLTLDGLANLVVYDEGYVDDNGVFQLWIADFKGVLIGKRSSGANIAEYRLTRNANNPNMAPGPFMDVVDTASGLEVGVKKYPREIQVYDGHNGGPVIFFPGSVISVNL